MSFYDVRADCDWSAKFTPEVGAIVGRHLLRPAPADEDRLRNTDLATALLLPVRVAVRVRQHQYLARYGGEVTIRLSRSSGAETEMAKLMAGWGDVMVYGFADPAGAGLAAWVLGDLSVFRKHVYHHLRHHQGRLPGAVVDAPQGSFLAVRVADLPREFVIARHPTPPPAPPASPAPPPSAGTGTPPRAS